MSREAHHGVPGRWGAQTWEVGDRAALTVQRCRDLIAGVLSCVGWEAEAPPTQRAEAAQARARGR